jgi:hypothetical protein
MIVCRRFVGLLPQGESPIAVSGGGGGSSSSSDGGSGISSSNNSNNKYECNEWKLCWNVYSA